MDEVEDRENLKRKRRFSFKQVVMIVRDRVAAFKMEGKRVHDRFCMNAKERKREKIEYETRVT